MTYSHALTKGGSLPSADSEPFSDPTRKWYMFYWGLGKLLELSKSAESYQFVNACKYPIKTNAYYYIARPLRWI
jgi:hypothetical protein